MKKKYMAAALGMSLMLAVGTGCGQTGASDTAAKTADTAISTADESDSSASETGEKIADETQTPSEAITGKITAIGDNTITVNDQEIKVTDSTEITKTAGMGQAPDGQEPDGNVPGGEAPDGETPPEKPTGEQENGETPPDKPAGEQENGETPPDKPAGEQEGGETPPDKPAGEQENGETPPDKPSGKQEGDGQNPPDGQMPGGETIAFTDLSVGDEVMITFADDGSAASIIVSDGSMAMGGGPGGSSSAPSEYNAVNTYSEDTAIDGDTIESTGTDENAIHVASGETTVSGATITRTSSDSTGGDNSSFYGVGAAVLATSGTLNISDSTITTDADGGAGVFAYGDSTVNVADTTITTRENTSGGIHVAGGGTLNAEDLNVTTFGESSAAIRSDRGGGTMTVNKGSYVSNGVGSPAVYCTADISVSDAELAANGSEAVCIEGLNSLRLKNCDLSGNMSDDEQNDCTWNVIVYQSMSGDAEDGNGTFEMDGGTLTTGNGGVFYTTNTESTITLRDVDLVSADTPDFFLMCTGNTNSRGWGNAGANGADCLFTGIDQEMQGDVVFDSISKLDFYMTEGSCLTGAVIDDESYAGSGGDGYCNLYIDEDSTWIVTGDSTLTGLYSMGTIEDADGKAVTIKGTDGTVYVQGDSAYTVTVSSYSTEVDLSGEARITE